MDAQDLLLRHGEKIALTLVLLIGGWAVYSALTDPEIRPDNTSAKEIHDKIGQIGDLRSRQEPPILKSAPDHLGDLKARFATTFQPRPVVANLTVHPDQGVMGPKVDGFYYIYELNPPIVAATDKIGAIDVAVSPAPSVPHEDPRISDEPTATWSREEKSGKVENRAEIVGYVLEESVGPLTSNSVWKQLAVLPADKPDFTVNNVTAFETYNFRASAVLKATGFVPNAGSGSSVLVHSGPYPDKPNWERLDPAKEQGLIAPANGLNQFPIAASELLYTSTPGSGPQATIMAGADIQLALKRVTMANPGAAGAAGADPEAGEEAPAAGAGGATEDEATFLITRFVRDAGGQNGAWIEPQEFAHVKVGQQVGGRKLVGPKGKQKEIDLTTPFVLDRVEKAERVLCWKLTFEPRPNGGKGKQPKVDKVAQPVDTAVLKNTKKNTVLHLAKLLTFTPPPRVIMYPDLGKEQVKELETFMKSPGSFKQPTLLPTEPTPHQPNGGPLQQLVQSGDDLAKTEAPYFELPDGRLVFWDTNNGHSEVKYKLGTSAKPDGKAEPGATDGTGDKTADPKSPTAAAADKPEPKPTQK